MKKRYLLIFIISAMLLILGACGDDDIRVSGVTLNLDNYAFTLSEEIFALRAIVEPANAMNKNIIWASDNTKVAVVDENGMITPISDGSCMISVITQDGAFEAFCAVTVKFFQSVPAIDSVTLDVKELKMTVGEQYSLKAVVLPEEADEKKLLYISADASVCEVDENGVLTAVGVGVATINVTDSSEEIFDNCVVTVVKNENTEQIPNKNTNNDKNEVIEDKKPVETEDPQTADNNNENAVDSDINDVVSDNSENSENNSVIEENNVNNDINSDNTNSENTNNNVVESKPDEIENAAVTGKIPDVANVKIDGNGFLSGDNLKAFNAFNSDCIAWIYIPGTTINTPVAYRSSDTVSDMYYLTHNLSKKSDKHGTVFIDFRNNLKKTQKITDDNTIFYCHASNSALFGQLKNVTNTEAWFNKSSNRYIYINTLYEETVWQIFATYFADNEKEQSEFTRIQFLLPVDEVLDKKKNERELIKIEIGKIEASLSDTNLSSDDLDKLMYKIIDLTEQSLAVNKEISEIESNLSSGGISAYYDKDAFLNYFNNWKNRSYIINDTSLIKNSAGVAARNFGVELKNTDKFITLITCAGNDEDIRYVVHAKLISSRPK